MAYWEEEAQAATFVNGYADVVAADVSWYGDPNVCAEATRWLQLPPAQCRLAANYGATVERLRALDAADGRGSRSTRSSRSPASPPSRWAAPR